MQTEKQITDNRPTVTIRKVHEGLYYSLTKEHLSPIQARIVAGRMKPEDFDGNPVDTLSPNINKLPSYAGLPDIELAAARVVTAIIAGQHVVYEVDHDADGTNSGAIIEYALLDIFGHPPEKLRPAISHRLKQGYGLNQKLAEQILQFDPKPDLVITADNGSSDQERIQLLLDHEISVVVTDHHQLPIDNYPHAAYAFVSPIREDSTFDQSIAGCTVAWYLMNMVRDLLIEIGHIPANSPTLLPALSYAALGTQADCVNLGKSKINRTIVRYGMEIMDREEKPAWKLIRNEIGLERYPIRSSHLSFQAAPRISAIGRLDDSQPGIRFLRTDDPVEAKALFKELNLANEERKEIQKQMAEDILPEARKKAALGNHIIVCFLPSGHPGIHGIISSKVTEELARPSIMFSPTTEDGVIAGSGRSVPGVHLKALLDEVNKIDPNMLITFGGHSAACGMRCKSENLAALNRLMNDLLSSKHTSLANAQRVYETDGVLSMSAVSISTLDQIMDMDPYGQGFPTPTFTGDLKLSEPKRIGADKNHLSFYVDMGAKRTRGIWFFVDPDILEAVKDGVVLTNTVYSLSENIFRAKRSLQIMIEYGEFK